MPAWIIKWFGLKVLDRAARQIRIYISERNEARKTLKILKEKIKDLKKAKTEEEIRELIRRL